MEAYSLDLRKRGLASCYAGKGTKEVARLFEVSPAWVRRLKQRRRQLNTIEPLPRKNGPDPKLTPQHRTRLREAVEQQPDLTLTELKHQFQLCASVPTICRALRAQMPDLDPRQLVFDDESGAKTNLTRTRGRSQRGERLKSCAPLATGTPHDDLGLRPVWRAWTAPPTPKRSVSTSSRCSFQRCVAARSS